MRWGWVVVALLLTGCVGRGRFDRLDEAHTALQTRATELEAQVRSLETDRDRLSAQVDTLQKALEDARGRLTAKSAEAGALAENVAEMDAALRELRAREARAQESLQTYRDLVERFRALIDAGTLTVRVVDGRMVVELATDVLFAPGSADLSPEGRTAIAEVGGVLATLEDRDFQVAGHTDDVPIATRRFPSNWHLGAARAIAVAELLVGSGLRADQVSAASYAEHKPVAPNRTDEGRARNRRIEIVVVPDLSQLPGYDELSELAGP